MLGYVTAASAGGTSEKLTFRAVQPTIISSIEARDATSVASIQIGVAIKDAYTAVLLARGDQDRVGDQIIWHGRLNLKEDEEIIALFYNTTAADKLELTVRVE